MEKKLKAGSGRNPPEPSESHEEIEDWLQRVMPDLQPTVRRLDELIREMHQDLRFALKWKKAYYGLEAHGWLIELVAYAVSVTVVFHGGADFEDPPPLGDTGRSRYVKVRSANEADTPEMRAWIKQAAGVAGWK